MIIVRQFDSSIYSSYNIIAPSSRKLIRHCVNTVEMPLKLAAVASSLFPSATDVPASHNKRQSAASHSTVQQTETA